MKLLTILFALLFSSFSFAETVTFECNYPSYSDETGNKEVSDEFKLTFMLDMDNGKAYMIGNNGSSEVTLIMAENVSFIEVTATGNVMTTTIAQNLTSIHSRNTVILREIVPSQYYGLCTLK